MRRLSMVLLSIPVGLGGCAAPPPASTVSTPPAAASPATVPATSPAAPPSAAAQPPATLSSAPPAASERLRAAKPVAAAARRVAAAKPTTKPHTISRHQPPAGNRSTAAVQTTVGTHDGAVPAPAQPAAAPSAPAAATKTLDLNALEQRLKDTHAIGLFTKLSLKNQVDDLLAQFRALYSGQSHTPLADLHQKYDLLLLKVLSLLQDADPPLAADIASSRQAIWSILADPKKFSKI